MKDKLKIWSPTLIIVTRDVNQEDQEILQDIIARNGWFVNFGTPFATPQTKVAILTWTPHVGVDPHELQKNYKFFSYTPKGTLPLAKPGRAAVFNFKAVPANIRVKPEELSIEFWQEIIATFVGKEGRVFVPFCEEGNMLLGAMNIGTAIFGFSEDKDLYTSFAGKVDQYPPGQYTSFPGTLTKGGISEL